MGATLDVIGILNEAFIFLKQRKQCSVLLILGNVYEIDKDRWQVNYEK